MCFRLLPHPHSNESQHLAEGTEVARFRRQFCLVLQQAISFRTRHRLCRQGVAPASPRQLRSQGPVFVQAHRTEGVTGSKGQEETNRVGDGIGVGGGNGDSNGDRGGNGDGSEDSSGDGNGDEDNGIGEGEREANKRKKPQNSCRRHMVNGGDFGGKRKKWRKERVGPVTANPDNLESTMEAGGGAQGTQGSSKNCTSRESVSPLSCLIRGFRNKYQV